MLRSLRCNPRLFIFNTFNCFILFNRCTQLADCDCVVVNNIITSKYVLFVSKFLLQIENASSHQAHLVTKQKNVYFVVKIFVLNFQAGPGSGLKLSINDTCERIKEEFNYIQNQYHRYLKSLKCLFRQLFLGNYYLQINLKCSNI